MHERDEQNGVKASDHDRERVRALRATARDALIEANRILSRYMDVDPDTVHSAVVGLRSDDDGGTDMPVPPVGPCIVFQDRQGACAYIDCDPPGATFPCTMTSR